MAAGGSQAGKTSPNGDVANISLQWTEKSMRFRVAEFPESIDSPEASLTKITMQETQHGQRIYHLVGGFNHLEKYMSIQ